MDHRKMSNEFKFIKDKLEKAARLLTTNNHSDQIEVAFIIGCLHTICTLHWENFSGLEKALSSEEKVSMAGFPLC